MMEHGMIYLAVLAFLLMAVWLLMKQTRQQKKELEALQDTYQKAQAALSDMEARLYDVETKEQVRSARDLLQAAKDKSKVKLPKMKQAKEEDKEEVVAAITAAVVMMGYHPSQIKSIRPSARTKWKLEGRMNFTA